MCCFTEEYEAYMKTLDVMYKTEVTTTVVQEPKVADLPPVVISEYDMQRRMAQQAHMMTFISERVKIQASKLLMFAYNSTCKI